MQHLSFSIAETGSNRSTLISLGRARYYCEWLPLPGSWGRLWCCLGQVPGRAELEPGLGRAGAELVCPPACVGRALPRAAGFKRPPRGRCAEGPGGASVERAGTSFSWAEQPQLPKFHVSHQKNNSPTSPKEILGLMEKHTWKYCLGLV